MLFRVWKVKGIIWNNHYIEYDGSFMPMHAHK